MSTTTITIIGTGYVGLVTAVCLAALGNRVVCHDIDSRKIGGLKRGKVSFYEPDLENLLESCIKEGRLSFTYKAEKALEGAHFIFICVGTPPKRDGSADLRAYFSVIREIKRVLGEENFKFLGSSLKLEPTEDGSGKEFSIPIVINKSTVPVGTAREAQKKLQGKALVVSNPEFLREGKAIADFMHPERIVLGLPLYNEGQEADRLKDALFKLYASFTCPKIITNWETAEMVKYASNAFLATKISFINEIARICEKTGADVRTVAEGMGYDARIGAQFLRAGVGYGGSCFPKDVRALNHIALNQNYDFKLLKAVVEVNNQQRRHAIAKILEALSKPYQDKHVCILGLSFKPETDDVRESASIFIIQELVKKGVRVKAYDPRAQTNARRALQGKRGVSFAIDAWGAAEGVDVLFLATEWEEFLSLDWGEVKRLMRGNTVIDGRNALDKAKISAAGLRYAGFGV